MIRLSYEFDTRQQLLDFLRNQTLDNGMLVAASPLAETPAVGEAQGSSPKASAEPVAATTQQAPARRGRPPKAAAPTTTLAAPLEQTPATPIAPTQGQRPTAATPTPNPIATIIKQPSRPVETIVNATAPLTADELRPLLRAVFTKNAKAATDILKSFGANRISDIKPEQSQAFAEACNKAVA